MKTEVTRFSDISPEDPTNLKMISNVPHQIPPITNELSNAIHIHFIALKFYCNVNSCYISFHLYLLR